MYRIKYIHAVPTARRHRRRERVRTNPARCSCETRFLGWRTSGLCKQLVTSPHAGTAGAQISKMVLHRLSASGRRLFGGAGFVGKCGWVLGASGGAGCAFVAMAEAGDGAETTLVEPTVVGKFVRGCCGHLLRLQYCSCSILPVSGTAAPLVPWEWRYASDLLVPVTAAIACLCVVQRGHHVSRCGHCDCGPRPEGSRYHNVHVFRQRRPVESQVSL